MAGQESFSNLDVRPQNSLITAHTPTTSSMLAALQQDPFPSFNADGYNPLSYMDTSSTQEDSLPGQFHDFVAPGNTFEVPQFGASQDLGMATSTTPASNEGGEPSDSEPEKPDTSTA